MAKNDPHILAIPYPLQGHINPMIQLCYRLMSKGVHVTLIITASIAASLQIRPGPGSLINIETVLDSTIDEVEYEHLDVYEIFIKRFQSAITRGIPDIIQKYRDSLRAIVYDSVNPWVLEIAHDNGLKGAVLFTQPCTVCSVFYHMHKGTLGLSTDCVESFDQISLPGMPVMGLKDLPSVVYDMNSYPSLLRLLIQQFSTFGEADWRLFNTFDMLEDEILKWMANKYPLRAIGPTIPSIYMDKRLQGNYDYGLSLFKPKTKSCLEWLNSKQDRSVIYVSFGSLIDISKKQMEELAWGLIYSKYNFIWVVRETEQSKLPRDFTPSEKGLIVKWCTQLEILSHRAVGCFITHCGWNSSLEALSLGVPIVVMPRWTDQTTNAKLIVDVWEIGVRVKADESGVVMREEISASVREVLQWERGHDMRKNIMKWKDLAVEAVSEGGSSDKNIAEIAEELLSI